MTKDQREMIVHTLVQFYDLREIAALPDADLYIQYRKVCKSGECDLKPLVRSVLARDT
jgi:hypothetical protein